MHMGLFYVGGARINIALTDLVDPEFTHKRMVSYSITLPYVPGSDKVWESGRVEIGQDLSVIPADSDDDTVCLAYASLLSSLGAAGESRDGSESSTIFSADVTEWARKFSDDIALAYYEIDEDSEEMA